MVKVLPYGVVLTLTLLSSRSYGSDSLQINSTKNHLKAVSIGIAGAAHAGSFLVLNNVWYDEFDRTSFHFFNDVQEWNGLDKVGHLTTSYALSEQSSRYFKAFGWQEKSDLAGAIFGFSYVSTLEILDAYSRNWGFSVYDLSSNFLGAGMYYTQQRIFKDQIVRFKWSYSSSGLASVNPSLLGESGSERTLKDYNGQTYWLSLPVAKMTRMSHVPEWLCLSLGYGITDFTRARVSQVPLNYHPRSEFYLSLDIDLSKLKVRSKWLKGLLKTVNFIKVPLPTLKFDSQNGFSFLPVYF